MEKERKSSWSKVYRIVSLTWWTGACVAANEMRPLVFIDITADRGSRMNSAAYGAVLSAQIQSQYQENRARWFPFFWSRDGDGDMTSSLSRNSEIGVYLTTLRRRCSILLYSGTHFQKTQFRCQSVSREGLSIGWCPWIPDFKWWLSFTYTAQLV